MKETLTCTQCEKRWRRERSRGRKPHLCPKCVKANAKLQPKPKAVVEVSEVSKVKKTRKVSSRKVTAVMSASGTENSNHDNLTTGKVYRFFHPSDEKLKEETKGGSKWKCKKCGYILDVKISLTAVPTHKCSEGSKSYPMERI